MKCNIIFVKHGDKYRAEHVNKLADQLSKYFPDSKFYCYTEDPSGVNVDIVPVLKKPTLKVWWNKLALFSEHMPFEGKCLYFDLDSDIKRDPRDHIEWNGLTVLNAYWKSDMYMASHAYDVLINSSVITWTAGEQTSVWNHFMSNRDYFMRKYKGIDRFLVHEKIELNTFKDGIVNSIANPYEGDAPIDIYNGIDYELQDGHL